MPGDDASAEFACASLLTYTWREDEISYHRCHYDVAGTYPVRRPSILTVPCVPLSTIHTVTPTTVGCSLCCRTLLLPRLVSSTSCDAFVVAVHAVDALPRLREDQFVDPILTHLAFETVRVIGIVAGHDGFVQNRLFADIAVVRAVRTYRRPVREKQEVRVGCYLVSAFCALETINMEEGLSRKRNHGQYRVQYPRIMAIENEQAR